MTDEFKKLNEFELRTCGISNRSTELYVNPENLSELRKQFSQFTFTETSKDSLGHILVKVVGK